MEIINWKNMNKDDIYCCFSFPQYKFLMSNGLCPIAIDTHKKTNRTFSIFVKGDKLQSLLTEWTANRPVATNEDSNNTIRRYSDWRLKESGDNGSERED